MCKHNEKGMWDVLASASYTWRSSGPAVRDIYTVYVVQTAWTNGTPVGNEYNRAAMPPSVYRVWFISLRGCNLWRCQFLLDQLTKYWVESNKVAAQTEHFPCADAAQRTRMTLAKRRDPSENVNPLEIPVPFIQDHVHSVKGIRRSEEQNQTIFHFLSNLGHRNKLLINLFVFGGSLSTS